MLHCIDFQQWRPLPSPLAIQKQYFIDKLNPRPGHVNKFEVAEKVCMDVKKFEEIVPPKINPSFKKYLHK